MQVNIFESNCMIILIDHIKWIFDTIKWIQIKAAVAPIPWLLPTDDDPTNVVNWIKTLLGTCEFEKYLSVKP